jgi:hypothetical protein
MNPESHTGQDIIDMQDASHGSYNVTANVKTVSHNDLETTVNLQGESSNNGTASDTNEDPAIVQAVNDLETTVDMQRDSSNNNGTASDTNEDTENVKQHSLEESIDGLILDPTEAQTPNASWCWLPAEVEVFGKETRESFTRTCVKFTKFDDQVVYSKSVTVIRNELFYRSKGVLVRPHFLPQSFVCILDLQDAIARFDSSSLCLGCDPKFGEQLATMKSVTQGKLSWRSKRCLKVLERGSTCHFCRHVNELLPLKQSKMEKLVSRNRKLKASNRAKEKLVKRRNDSVKVIILKTFAFCIK